MATLGPPPPDGIVAAPLLWARWLKQVWDTVRGASDLAPSLGTVANTKGAQTLQNKTISGASNTLSNIALTSLLTTYWAVRGGTTSIPNAGVATVVFPTEDLDSAGAYNTGTGIFTVQTAGIYYVGASVLLESATYTNQEIHLKKGSTIINGNILQNLNGYNAVATSLVIQLAAADTLSVEFTQNNAALAARAVHGDGRFTYFHGWRIA